MLKALSTTLLVALSPLFARADVFSIVSNGLAIPETITPIPTGFGTVGGELMVPDLGNFGLYTVPVGGGVPTLFASGVAGNGGVFLPSTFGALAGDFLVPEGPGGLAAVNGSGTVTQLPPIADMDLSGGVAIAPSTFGAIGGSALIANDAIGTTANVGSILTMNPDGTVSSFAAIGAGTNPYGLVFAPSDFGSSGGDLFVTDALTGSIYTVDSSGNVSLFMTLAVPVLTGGDQAGLRQLAFAPAGFGAYGGDLFVSVSGSQRGGGVSGSVDVVDGSGSLVAVLEQGSVGMPFDPRGLYFADDSDLYIADTDPGILSAPPSAFTPVPEPFAPILLITCLGMLVAPRVLRKLQAKTSRCM
jgi:hypothetical protein